MRVPRLAAVVGLLLAVAGCSGGTTDAAGSDDTTLTVLAAASLTETFTELERIYEKDHAGVDVRLAFDSSTTLAGQVVEGAPGDVLATADARTMRTATDAGATAEEPTLFATNTMALVVPADNPAGIETFADLDQDGVSYVACAESAPCGALARSLLDLNHVEAAPKSFEINVKAVLTKVELDEADAGLVYATDAASAGDMVDTIAIPNSSEAVTSHLVAPLQQSEHGDLAREWVALTVSEEGQDVLREAGFGTP